MPFKAADDEDAYDEDEDEDDDDDDGDRRWWRRDESLGHILMAVWVPWQWAFVSGLAD